MSRPATRVLGTFTLAMITMAAIVTLRNLSFIAALGVSAVFFLCLAAVIFFIPTALVVAELAATWPRPGGCYVWVSEAFGKPLGFITLWASWMASVAWFPTILIFVAVLCAQLLSPVLPLLELNTTFILVCMLAVFWLFTLLNFLGIEFSGFITSSGVMLGTIIPGAIIILLGMWWVYADQPAQIVVSMSNLVPDLNIDNVILFSGVLLTLAGVELAAYHVREAKDPQHTYPRAVLLALAAILLMYILGTLAIVIVVPQEELSLTAGIVQAFTVFFHHLGLNYVLTILTGCLLLGALASVNAWVAGPAKGMLVVAEDGFLPPWLHRTNKKGVPTALLTLQGVVGSILCILFIYMNSNTFVWLLTALSAQFTCLEYILIFCAALRLRHSQPHVHRPFKVKAIWPLSICGIVACAFGFAIVYVPHSQLVALQGSVYNWLLIISLAILLFPTLFMFHHRHRLRKRSA